jgi:hypothetical protein
MMSISSGHVYPFLFSYILREKCPGGFSYRGLFGSKCKGVVGKRKGRSNAAPPLSMMVHILAPMAR